MRTPRKLKPTSQQRLDLFNETFTQKRIPTDIFKASTAGMLELDKKYHLEGVVQLLRNLQTTVSVCLIGSDINEGQKQEVTTYITLLHDLAAEFEWQTHYGIRLYEPL